MIHNLKSIVSSTFSTVKANMTDLVLFFTENPQPRVSFFLCTVLSTLLVCHGINFNHELIVYMGLLISPFSFAFIQFTISLYQQNSFVIRDSFINIILGSILVFLISLLYYSISPFAFNHNVLRSFSQVQLVIYLVVFIIGVTLGVFNRSYIIPFIYILNILMKWTVLIAIASIAVVMKDWIWLKQIVINYKLVFVFLFVGITFRLWLMKIEKMEIEKKLLKYFYWLISILILVFGIYFGCNELARLTTEYNVKSYVSAEFESKSFQLNNFFIDNASREVTLYYTGIRPAKAQDEILKKKYHLEGYHIVFTEIK